MRIYIAGKMRGIKDFNRDAFYQAENMLIKQGYDVFNPVRYDENHGMSLISETGTTDDIEGFTQASLVEIVLRDVKHLTACDAIYLLKSWQDSKGATAEKAVAEWLGLELMFEGEL